MPLAVQGDNVNVNLNRLEGAEEVQKHAAELLSIIFQLTAPKKKGGFLCLVDNSTYSITLLTPIGEVESRDAAKDSDRAREGACHLVDGSVQGASHTFYFYGIGKLASEALCLALAVKTEDLIPDEALKLAVISDNALYGHLSALQATADLV